MTRRERRGRRGGGMEERWMLRRRKKRRSVEFLIWLLTMRMKTGGRRRRRGGGRQRWLTGCTYTWWTGHLSYRRIAAIGGWMERQKVLTSFVSSSYRHVKTALGRYTRTPRLFTIRCTYTWASRWRARYISCIFPLYHVERPLCESSIIWIIPFFFLFPLFFTLLSPFTPSPVVFLSSISFAWSVCTP